MTDEHVPGPRQGRASRRRRLSRSAEFERVYRQGRSKANRYLVLYAFPREEDPAASAPASGRRPASRRGQVGLVPPSAGAAEEAASGDGPRLGLSVSRKVGGAVDRSRVKRVLREAFWAEASRLPPGSDYVIVARPEARGLAERDGMSGIRTALAELVDGLGGRKAGPVATDAPDATAPDAAEEPPDATVVAASGADAAPEPADRAEAASSEEPSPERNP